MGNTSSTPSIDPLTLLRTDPATAFSRYAYLTAGIPAGPTANSGGCVLGVGRACDLTYADGGTSGRQHFVILSPTDPDGDGHVDYCYPWVNAQKGVGMVRVPASAPVGTLVITAAMNGCALQVNKKGDAYYFLHDSDAKSLTADFLQDKGNQVLRILPNAYDPGGAFTQAAAVYSHNGTLKNYGAYLIAVRTAANWKVYASCVIDLGKVVSTGKNTESFVHDHYVLYPLPNRLLGQFV